VQKQSKAQDKVVHYLIYFISLFSDDVTSQLDQIRMKSQLKPSSSKAGKVSYENKEDINLKEVPIEFI